MLRKCFPQGLWDRLPEAQKDSNYVMSEEDVFQIFNSGTGEVLKTIPALGIRGFSSRKLRALFVR